MMGGLALLILVSGCGRNGSPFASFEARCAKLSPPSFVVVQVPVTYRIDNSMSVEELTRKSGNTVATQRTMGLTVGTFGYSSDVELRSVEDARGKRVCGTPAIHV